MPGIGAILAGVGTALGGAASAGSAIASGSLNRKNRKWQEKMYNLQVTQRREDAQAQYERTKDYAQWAWNRFESPTAQRAAMEAAGMNPFVEGSVIQPMGTPQGNVSQAEGGSVPSQGPYQNNPMSNIMAGASSLREAAMQGVQAENIQAQTEYTNAQRLKTIAETKGIENSNSLFEFVRSAAESDALSKKFAAKIKQIESEWAEIKAIQDADERDVRIAELWSREEKNLADAAKTDADRLTVDTLRDGMKRLQDAQIENVEAQTNTEGAKKLNLEALTETENALRDGRIKIQFADAKRVVQQAFGARLQNAEQIEKLARLMTATDRPGSVANYLDKIAEQIGGSDQDDKENVKRRFYEELQNFVSLSE